MRKDTFWPVLVGLWLYGASMYAGVSLIYWAYKLAKKFMGA